MGVNLSGSVPANPGASGSIFDSILDGAGSLGQALWAGLDGVFNFVGDVFKGAVDLGGHIIGGALNLVQGTIDFFGNIGNMVVGWFNRDSTPPVPLPEIFSPIAADLEADMEPFLSKIETVVSESSQLGTKLDNLNTELGELIDPTSPDGPLWLIQEQINSLKDDRDDLQDEALAASGMALEALQRYISRGMFLPDSTRVSKVTNPHWEVTFVNGKRRMVAIGSWVGDFIYQSALHRSGDFGPVIEGGAVGPANRTFDLDTATAAGTLQYWIRPGEAKSFATSRAGFSPARDTWHTVTEFTHQATAAGKHYVQFRVNWHSTTREDSYGIQVLRNGAVDRTLKQVGIGPWLPGQDGRRTQTMQYDLTLAVDDVLTFQVFAGSPNSGERYLSSTSIAIQWQENAVESDIVYTT